MSLKIQVLGKGLIPRGYGLAPRKDPFNADLTLIQTILSTPGLIVNYIRPEDNKPVALDRNNLKRVWDKYNNHAKKQVAQNVSATTNTRPSAPVTKPIPEPAPVPPVVKPVSSPATPVVTSVEDSKVGYLCTLKSDGTCTFYPHKKPDDFIFRGRWTEKFLGDGKFQITFDGVSLDKNTQNWNCDITFTPGPITLTITDMSAYRAGHSVAASYFFASHRTDLAVYLYDFA